MSKIVEARILPASVKHDRYQAQVWGRYEGKEEEEKIFCYYDDEISFSTNEIVGKTLDEVLNLWGEKDLTYLRS